MSDPIKHVVLLMMENRSFDQVLGCMKALHPTLDGIDPNQPASNWDAEGREYRQTPNAELEMMWDPPHDHAAMKLALAPDTNHGVTVNGGFVDAFVRAHPGAPIAARQQVMSYFRRGALPVTHALAEQFTICDRWFASVPGQTWPNRFFSFMGTSEGDVNIAIRHIFSRHRTVFDSIESRGGSWRIYHDRVPLTYAHYGLRRRRNSRVWSEMGRFYRDAAGKASEFPSFAMIEPNYTLRDWGNDNHPPSTMSNGERLLAKVYNALRGNEELWASTLFVVTYDENGGFYDHVAPRRTVAPDNSPGQHGFKFDMTGPRVPTLLISPWVRAGVWSGEHDHTSLLRYLADTRGFNPQELGERTAQATSFAGAVTGPFRPDTPNSVAVPGVAALNADPFPDGARSEMAGAMLHLSERAEALLKTIAPSDRQLLNALAADPAAADELVARRIALFSAAQEQGELLKEVE